jgi:hypothetical protein
MTNLSSDLVQQQGGVYGNAAYVDIQSRNASEGVRSQVATIQVTSADVPNSVARRRHASASCAAIDTSSHGALLSGVGISTPEKCVMGKDSNGRQGTTQHPKNCTSLPRSQDEPSPAVSAWRRVRRRIDVGPKVRCC